MPKTIQEFRCQTDIWPLVDEWAHGQRLLFTEEPSRSADIEASADSPRIRTYKAGSPASLTAAYIRIIQVGNVVRLEGWKSPGERAIESFSIFGATNPYMLAAKPAFNKLLEKLRHASLGSVDPKEVSEVVAGSALSEYTAMEDRERRKKQIIRDAALPWVLAGCFVLLGGGILWVFGYSGFCLPMWVLGVIVMLVGNVRGKQALDKAVKTVTDAPTDAESPSQAAHEPEPPQ